MTTEQELENIKICIYNLDFIEEESKNIPEISISDNNFNSALIDDYESNFPSIIKLKSQIKKKHLKIKKSNKEDNQKKLKKRDHTKKQKLKTVDKRFENERCNYYSYNFIHQNQKKFYDSKSGHRDIYCDCFYEIEHSDYWYKNCYCNYCSWCNDCYLELKQNINYDQWY